jgi:hypothetical protein
MKSFIACVVIVAGLGFVNGCTTYSALAQGPSADKVFITKTTTYIIWATNKMLLCDFSGASAKNCTEVTEE